MTAKFLPKPVCKSGSLRTSVRGLQELNKKLSICAAAKQKLKGKLLEGD